MSSAVRWTVSVSPETDLSLRNYLGAQGMKKGDLSKFVEDAVRWRMFDRSVQSAKDRNQDISPEELEELINQEVRQTRTKRRSN